ncbi:MAG: glycosyl transferase family 2, partial [Thermoleophilia bacterium]|nr:glycosyl transferase family 2 [Thermoleophilia bacterium]
MQPDVSVIVVTYNASDHLAPCLDAVVGAGGEGVELELLVVDNASSDGTPDLVRERWPSARVIDTGRNGGMAAGNNAGMLEARGRSFLLLNSDAYLQPGALATMLERLRSEPPERLAAVAPALRNVDGSVQRSVRGFPTPWRYATEFWYLRRIAPGSRALNAFYGGGLDLAEPRTIEWATGACLLVPRSAVDAVGLMDEAYFMYGEEVDWLHRMRAVGRSVAWEPRALVTHVGGGSTGRSWGALYQRQLANHVRYMARAHGAVPARRTGRILRSALQMRALLWRVASLVPGSGSTARRE